MVKIFFFFFWEYDFIFSFVSFYLKIKKHFHHFKMYKLLKPLQNTENYSIQDKISLPKLVWKEIIQAPTKNLTRLYILKFNC